MKFVEAEVEKGNARRPYKKMKDELEVFMRMNVKSAKVIYTKQEYTSAAAANKSLHDGAINAGLPIKTTVRNGTVYLVRTDL